MEQFERELEAVENQLKQIQWTYDSKTITTAQAWTWDQDQAIRR
jgi:hypothetical protein